MNHFAFPPPPPPPPKANQSTNSSYYGPTSRDGYAARGFRGGRGFRGQDRGNFRGATRGGCPQGSNLNPHHGASTLSSTIGRDQQSRSHFKDCFPTRNDIDHGIWPYHMVDQVHMQPNMYSSFNQNAGQNEDNQGGSRQNTLNSGLSHKQTTFMGDPILGAMETQSYCHPLFDRQSNHQRRIDHASKLIPSTMQHVSHKVSNQQHNRQAPTLNHRGQGQKRNHANAFSRNHGQKIGTAVAPAVPSYGAPLPLPPKLQVPLVEYKVFQKRQHKHNQLGLTPTVTEHGLSEEDDEDEESRLTATIGGADLQEEPLQVTYKGQTLNLSSASDIEKWIYERRRRYPTKARIAEAVERKQREKMHKDSQNKGKVPSEDRKKESRKRKPEVKSFEESGNDAIAKAKVKVEKLRRQLEKEERKIVEAEGHAANSLPKSELTSTPDKRVSRTEQRPANISKSQCEGAVEPLTPTSKPSTPSSSPQRPQKCVKTFETAVLAKSSQSGTASGTLLRDPTSSLLTTDSDDLTSSSGSSSSDVDSSDAEAPAEVPLGKSRPNKDIPPLLRKPKKICHAFLNRGRCQLGPRCRYRHEIPARDARSKRARNKAQGGFKPEGRGERISLYQRLVNQEKEKEDQTGLAALEQHDERAAYSRKESI